LISKAKIIFVEEITSRLCFIPGSTSTTNFYFVSKFSKFLAQFFILSYLSYGAKFWYNVLVAGPQR